MGAKYFIRIDDACSRMNLQKWKRAEDIFDQYQIKPIVAVIPKNADIGLVKGPEIKDFWSIVIRWRDKGWHIAMHGYNHLRDSNSYGFFPVSDYSEFAGKSIEVQREKITKAYQIFKNNGIEPTCWVAPSHGFDTNTLAVLKEITKIEIVSDGLTLSPYEYKGFKWVPQQFGKFISFPFGVWTICMHPNSMQEEDFERMEKFIIKHRNDFINLSELTGNYRKMNFIDYINNWTLFSYKWLRLRLS